MSKVHSPTDVIVMTVGGNNAGFFDIASNCIYHQRQEDSSFNYGHPYENDPDRSGLCAKSIDDSRKYIDGDFARDITITIQEMLNLDVVKANPKIRIYYTGYAEFFNLNDDWCDKESFNALPSFVPSSRKAFLSHVLRSDMNDLTTRPNNKIKATISQFTKQNVQYLSINEGFEGHRFCEKGSYHSNEYYGSNVWFWNLSPPPLFGGNVNSTTHFDDQGQFLAALTANATAKAPKSLNLNSALAQPLFENDLDATPNSDTGAVPDGWRMRPFHPKLDGHRAIKDAIIAQLKKDKVPGVQ